MQIIEIGVMEWWSSELRVTGCMLRVAGGDLKAPQRERGTKAQSFRGTKEKRFWLLKFAFVSFVVRNFVAVDRGLITVDCFPAS